MRIPLLSTTSLHITHHWHILSHKGGGYEETVNTCWEVIEIIQSTSQELYTRLVVFCCALIQVGLLIFFRAIGAGAIIRLPNAAEETLKMNKSYKFKRNIPTINKRIKNHLVNSWDVYPSYYIYAYRKCQDYAWYNPQNMLVVLLLFDLLWIILNASMWCTKFIIHFRVASFVLRVTEYRITAVLTVLYFPERYTEINRINIMPKRCRLQALCTILGIWYTKAPYVNMD